MFDGQSALLARSDSNITERDYHEPFFQRFEKWRKPFFWGVVFFLGLSDVAGDKLVKIYCPRCMDVYNPATGSEGMNIDGAYFGTGFPHMVFMTRPEYRPSRPKGRHVSKLYGFRVHKIAGDLQRHEAIEYRRSLLSNNATNAHTYSTARESTSTMPMR